MKVFLTTLFCNVATLAMCTVLFTGTGSESLRSYCILMLWLWSGFMLFLAVSVLLLLMLVSGVSASRLERGEARKAFDLVDDWKDIKTNGFVRWLYRLLAIGEAVAVAYAGYLATGVMLTVVWMASIVIIVLLRSVNDRILKTKSDAKAFIGAGSPVFN